MAVPKSVTKVDRKGGVTFTSNVDAVNYTIKELSRAALRDTAKYLRKLMIIEMKKMPGMKRNKRIYRSMQFWNRAKSKDLLIGVKHAGWYGAQQEFGTHGQPARGIIRGVTMANINEIQRIQAQYLSALSQENPSLNGTSEEEYKSPDGEEK